MTGQGLAETSTFISYFLSVFIALGIVLVLAWLVIRLLSGRMASWGMKGRNIGIIETMPLGYKRNLHIVEIGEKVMLIGSSDGGLSLLAKIDKNELTIPEKPDGTVISKFLEILKGKKKM